MPSDDEEEERRRRGEFLRAEARLPGRTPEQRAYLLDCAMSIEAGGSLHWIDKLRVGRLVLG